MSKSYDKAVDQFVAGGYMSFFSIPKPDGTTPTTLEVVTELCASSDFDVWLSAFYAGEQLDTITEELTSAGVRAEYQRLKDLCISLAG